MATHQHVHQCISKPINTMMKCVKMVTEAIEKEKHKRSKRAKNSYIGYNHVHINTDVFHIYTTKSVVPFKKDYKIL